MTRRPFHSETDLLTRTRTKVMPAPKRDLWNSALLIATGLGVCGIGFLVLAKMVS